MLDLAHVVLHLGLCQAIGRAPAAATLAVRVHLTDHTGRMHVDHVYRLQRGEDPEAVIEFDSTFGIYRLDVEVPKYRCSATDYLFFIAGANRTITEQLHDAPAPPPPKPMLLSGTAPQSFLYVQPTFVLFDKRAVACDKPIPEALPSNIVVENDQDGYYAWLYPEPSTAASSPAQLALRLRTTTHQYHYVRIPIPYPVPWGGWPESIQFNVTQDMVDDLAGKPVNTLLCPKLWRTSAG
ncbi:MAG: hypothetical protein JO311_04095 [Candidatus Eremiobacteraeota bacterium]|nr:hypothetical protein [Candidatus Eremiobacteraeota bacterium]